MRWYLSAHLIYIFMISVVVNTFSRIIDQTMMIPKLLSFLWIGFPLPGVFIYLEMKN